MPSSFENITGTFQRPAGPAPLLRMVPTSRPRGSAIECGAMHTRALLDRLGQARTIDLAQPYYVGMPHHPNHPPFLYGLNKAHGESVAGEVSAAAESIALGGHVGTHIDALCHFSFRGRLHGGADAAVSQSHGAGLAVHHVDTIDPIFRRGILLDVAGDDGVDALAPDFVADADCLRRAAERAEVAVEPGDVVLVRTGWARYWFEPGRYINSLHCPGVNREAAEWLSAQGVFAAGSDTIAFESMPAPTMPVHVHLLVESGIHIIEALDLEGLARSGVREFVFTASPLRIRGGTGSPIRPLAITAP